MIIIKEFFFSYCLYCNQFETVPLPRPPLTHCISSLLQLVLSLVPRERYNALLCSPVMASSLEEFYIVRLHHSPSPGFLGVTCISLPTTPLGAGATSEAPRGHQAFKKKWGRHAFFGRRQDMKGEMLHIANPCQEKSIVEQSILILQHTLSARPIHSTR